MDDEFSNGLSEHDDDTQSDLVPDFGAYTIQHVLLKHGHCRSYKCDLNLDSFNMQWLSLLEFEAWLDSESKKLSIDFTVHETIQDGCCNYCKFGQYTKKVHYICSQGYSGGQYSYVKKTKCMHAVPLKHVQFLIFKNLPSSIY